MKINRYIKAALLALVGTALASSSMPTQAQQTTTYLDTFPADGNTAPFSGGAADSVASWLYWYGVVPGNTSMTNDPSMDAAGDSTSGSLQVYIPFGAAGNQQVMFGTFGNHSSYDNGTLANGTLFTNITMDVHVAPGTPLSPSGDFGQLQIGMADAAFDNGGYFYPGDGGPGTGLTIPASATNGWAHLNQLIDQTTPNIASVCGVDLKYVSYSGYPTNPILFWVDNISVHLNPGPPPPAPTLSSTLTVPVTGENFIAVVNSGLNHRYDLGSVSNNYSWINATSSVSYSITIKSFPTTNFTGFQAQIFLIPGVVGTENAPDYNEASCIFFTIQNNGSGGGNGIFRYKTNEPSGNAMLFNGTDPNYNGTMTSLTYPQPGGQTNPLAQLTDTSVVGKWTLTFRANTNVTVTGPSGATTNFTMNADAAQVFSNPLTMYVGGQENSGTEYGQSVVLSQAAITGSIAGFVDNFDGETTLNTNIWNIRAADNTGVQTIPPGSAYWVDWTLPDVGYSLQTVGHLPGGSSWSDVTGLSIQDAGKRHMLVASSFLQNPNQGFFRLLQRTFTKLLVVFPGETIAPGTATGKTGTPTPVPDDGTGEGLATTTFTVYAVDATFHPISGISDTVTISTSDGAGLTPRDAALVNGMQTFIISFGTGPTQTVTATDVTDGTKTPGTSSPVPLTP